MSATVRFRVLLVFLTLIVGLLIYVALEHCFHGCGQKLFDESKKEVATIVSTFAIALTGLLAGFVVLVTGLRDSFFARRFKNSDSYADYLYYYIFTIVCLIATHCLTIPSLVSFGWFKVLIGSMLMNIFQCLLLAISAYRISVKGERCLSPISPPTSHPIVHSLDDQLAETPKE